MQRGFAGSSTERCINDETNTLCRSEGGHLASVDDQSTQNFLVKKERTGIWIGAYQMGKEDDWRWSDCTPWNWTMWDQEFHNGRRPQPQPDNYGTENCVMINWSGYAKWHDVGCSWTNSFVCSKGICKVTATTTMEPENEGIFLHHLPQALLCLLVKM